MATEVGTILSDYSYVWRRAVRSLFDTLINSSEGTLIVDRQAKVVWISEKYAAHFGFADPKIAIGLDCETVVPNSLMREVVKTGKPILLDILETEREPFIVTRLPLKDDNGATIGAIGFALFGQLKALTPLFSQYSRLQAELIATRHALAHTRRARYSLSNFVGTSPASMEVKRLALRAAQVDFPVLLLGETGTGKELIAHAIHGESARADKPFVAVNVAAIPDSLLEVELFGAAAGAYTGADRKGRVGKFELASDGTLFLDEIGDMPLSLQSKLLRVLQEKEFEPLGSNRVVATNARIIAATSVALPELVAARRFRADLYYRLNVLVIRTPPLRKRAHDIAALSDMILDELVAHHHIGRPELSEDALQLLREHAWPGNVRELRNTLERAVIFSDHQCIDANLLVAFVNDIDSTLSAPEFAREHGEARDADINEASYENAMRMFEKRFLGAALRCEGGCVSKAAARIGIGRATFYKKMAALGI
ncbi:transcriptional regulator with PAS, ATPase and Fis domain [Paraburkholderia atlantica]|uniref:Transcriptional regulator with PAS, ATPase and Fis domain n=2 Tax=Paraburkholderia TaxID=1822464 RepID=A0A7W8LEY1_9BURK|nr:MULTISPECIES: sigma 54-interacting transcriptional regulator [Paraburkholderia]MBB5405742.1 transcriptional regulator with PAS, ATPase and Fis domain [Paraburkholderia youngii]MBB5421488.1 transcriptional regulator with PAS, ATPase and Fis domain [Paraburkholderia atlantica]MBB5429431.1 transcriptional regulator with PAS, ATPase and Fis domain [Paraburkholderia atlantica]MPW10781.1 AAA family ATPase [Paraburkholderia atlantica]NUY35699.1 AAA family ATPase [Paraburkholderia atlantica]